MRDSERQRSSETARDRHTDSGRENSGREGRVGRDEAGKVLNGSHSEPGAVFDCQDMSLWTPNGEVDGVKTYSGVGKLPSARGDGMIPFPANILLELFTDVQRSKEFDELFDTGRTVDRVDEQVGAGMVCWRGVQHPPHSVGPA